MPVSFATLWEEVERLGNRRKNPLMGSGEDGRAMETVRTGEDMAKEGETPFWDSFITLCGNADGLSQLLGVSPDKVMGWPARIGEFRDRMDRERAENPSEKPKAEIVPTGDNGAVTPTNADPLLGGN